MAELHPFRAHRFDPVKVGDLSRVVTQPYDKISPDLQQDYYERSPLNIARITFNRERNSDPETEYPDAGRTWEQWRRDGSLTRDARPGFYAYYQEFEVDGERRLRKGFIGLLDLKHAGTGILPHERTMSGPKMDRLRLMRRTESNDDLIFMLYTDDTLAVNRVLDRRCAEGEPEMEAKDDDGVVHRVWSVTGDADLKAIREAMVPEELFIADGHHRYETALNFMKECEEKGWKPAALESFDKRMVTCFNSADRGVVILPTHRLLRDLPDFDPAGFLRDAGSQFEVETMDSAEMLFARMKSLRAQAHVVGFHAGGRFSLLRAKPGAESDPLLLAHGEAYRDLDVSILHLLILEKLLGIGEEKLVSQAHVDYARDRQECVREVSGGKYQAAFFLNPTSVEQVQRVALTGERMPQKSTDFYPKLLTGLVFMQMEIRKP